jgi:cytochrome c oxidase subunit 2
MTVRNSRSILLTTSLTIVGGFALLAVSLAQEKPEVRDIAITAKKYEFSPSEIRVRQGEAVRLSITALDRKHGFKIEALDVDRELPKGEVVTIELQADRAGTFPIACSKFCGLGHGKMKGQLIVE